MRRILALSLLAFGLSTQALAQIRVVGSDLVRQPVIALAARSESLKVQSDLIGSQPALAALRENTADLAFVLDAPGTAADYTGLRRVPFAYLAAIFVVSDRNPIENLNRSQLRGLFGAEETAKFNRWGDLGLTGEFANRNINVRSVAPRTTLAYDFFRHTVLQTPRTRPNLQLEESVDALVRALQQDNLSIGLSPLPPQEGSGLKALAISGDAGETPFPPSLENIHLGDYKHRLPIEIVYSSDRRELVRAFVEELFSETSAADLRAAAFAREPTSATRNRVGQVTQHGSSWLASGVLGHA
jgi:hypothetical protein